MTIYPKIRQNNLNWKTRNNHKYLLRPTRKKKKLNVGGLELIGMDIFRSEN